VYLRAPANGAEARQSLTRYFAYYDEQCLHEVLDYAIPDEAYFGKLAAATPRAA
jgi:hypothetical protein